MRIGDMKLVHHVAGSTFELYDLSSDLSEKTNLYVDEDGIHADKMNELYTRLMQTGPCPLDNDSTFEVSGTENSGLVVDCDWFRESIDRCDSYLEGRLNCNSVCANQFNKRFCERTTLPSSPYFPACQDANAKFWYDGEKKSCRAVDWLGTDLCYDRIDVKLKCPASCSSSSCKCFDTEGSFNFKSKSKTCEWAGRKKSNRCKLFVVLSHCPQTCDKC